jgi:hypothetical protein
MKKIFILIIILIPVYIFAEKNYANDLIGLKFKYNDNLKFDF